MQFAGLAHDFTIIEIGRRRRIDATSIFQLCHDRHRGLPLTLRRDRNHTRLGIGHRLEANGPDKTEACEKLRLHVVDALRQSLLPIDEERDIERRALGIATAKDERSQRFARACHRVECDRVGQNLLLEPEILAIGQNDRTVRVAAQDVPTL